MVHAAEKHSPRIEMLGAIDELNCWIGVFIALCEDGDVKTRLKAIQKRYS
jgi:cob(I)alamin adenosyltransferase